MIIPPLSGEHDGVPSRGIWDSWLADPILATAVLGAVFIYLFGLSRLRAAPVDVPLPRWRVWSYFAGVLAFSLALLSPIAAYSDELFSMHMVQHLLLLLVAPPLILVGSPILTIMWALPKDQRRTVGRWLRPGQLFARVGYWLTIPYVAVTLYVISVGIWHIPAMYDAAQGFTFTHTLQHAMFYGTALLYWWPIVTPARVRRRLRTSQAFPYLLPPFLEGMLIGVVLTFSDRVVYETYSDLDSKAVWGMSALTDQQLGGLIMWVPGGLFFLIPLIGLLMRLLQEDENRATSSVRPKEFGQT